MVRSSALIVCEILARVKHNVMGLSFFFWLIPVRVGWWLGAG